MLFWGKKKSGFLLEEGMNQLLAKSEMQSRLLNLHKYMVTNSTGTSTVVLNSYHCEARILFKTCSFLLCYEHIICNYLVHSLTPRASGPFQHHKVGICIP